MSGLDLNKVLEYAKANELEINIVVDGVFSFSPVKIRITSFANSWPITNQEIVSGITTNPTADQTDVIMRQIKEQHKSLEDYAQEIANSVIIRKLGGDTE